MTLSSVLLSLYLHGVVVRSMYTLLSPNHTLWISLGMLYLKTWSSFLKYIFLGYFYNCRCTADCGWITGHSYVTYGPLLNGAAVVVFEGVFIL